MEGFDQNLASHSGISMRDTFDLSEHHEQNELIGVHENLGNIVDDRDDEIQNSDSQLPIFNNDDAWSFVEVDKSDTELINESMEFLLDGALFLGKTWNLMAIDGCVTLLNKFHVQSEPELHFKGVPEAKSKHRYEILLTQGHLDNGTLSLLITSNADAPKSKGKQYPIIYSEVCARLSQIIREAINSLDCSTKRYMSIRSDDKLVIYQNDWEAIGNMVATRLGNLNTKDRSIFPADSKFYFLFKKFGQDRPFKIFDKIIHYPHLRLENVFRMVVHIAVDQSYEDNVLFFNKNFYQTISTKQQPNYFYNVGLIPKVGNYIFTEVKENNSYIKCVQQYTRIFHALHRNESEYFNDAVIAKSMLNSYTEKLNSKTSKYKRDPILQAILRGVISRIHHGIQSVIREENPIKSRTELVWSVTSEELSFLNQTEVFDAAYAHSKNFVTQNRCCDGSLFVILRQENLVEYLEDIFNHLFHTIEVGREKLSSFLSHDDQELMQAEKHAISVQDFADLYVAEGLLKRILRGDLSKFPEILKTLIDHEPDQSGQMYAWPFRWDLVWKENDIIKTKVPITKLLRNFSTVLGGNTSNEHMIEMYSAYNDWMSVSRTVGQIERSTCLLFKRVATAFVQKAVTMNHLAADTDILAIKTLWSNLVVHTNPNATKIKTSIELFTTITSEKIRDLRGFISLTTFVSLLKTQMTERQRGGCQLALAVALDAIMGKANLPFLLRTSSLSFIFLPLTFNKANESIIDIYHAAFKVLYKRMAGSRQIHVVQFLRPLLTMFEDIAVTERPKNLHNILDIINRLLDSEDVRKSTMYLKLPNEIQDALHEDDLPIFAKPIPPPPKPRSKREVVCNDFTGFNDEKRITRAEAEKRRQEEKKKCQADADALIDNLIYAGWEQAPSACIDDNSDSCIRPVIKRTRSDFAIDSDIESNSDSAEQRDHSEPNNELISNDQSNAVTHMPNPSPNLDFSDRPSFGTPRPAENAFVLGLRNQTQTESQSDTPSTPSTSIGYHNKNFLFSSPTSSHSFSWDVPTKQHSATSSFTWFPRSRTESSLQSPILPQTSFLSMIDDTDDESSLLSQGLGFVLLSDENSSQSSAIGQYRFPYKSSSESETPPRTTSPEYVKPISPEHILMAHDSPILPNRLESHREVNEEPINYDWNAERPVWRNEACGDNTSECSSANTEISRGLCFRPNKRVFSGTIYDMVYLPKVHSTLNHDNASKTSAKQYTVEETRSVFKFLHENDWLLYMKGMPVCNLMHKLKIVVRPAQGINTHIKKMLNSDELRGIVGEKIYMAITRAQKEIAKHLYTNQFPKDEAFERYEIQL